MNYAVLFKPSADRELQKLPPQIKDRVIRQLEALENTPRLVGYKKLKARPGYRIRVGDYRVIYAIDDGAHIVRILAIGHRRDVYQ